MNAQTANLRTAMDQGDHGSGLCCCLRIHCLYFISFNDSWLSVLVLVTNIFAAASSKTIPRAVRSPTWPSFLLPKVAPIYPPITTSTLRTTYYVRWFRLEWTFTSCDADRLVSTGTAPRVYRFRKGTCRSRSMSTVSPHNSKSCIPPILAVSTT